MNDFKVGDRVEYVGPNPRNRGKTFTINELSRSNAWVKEDGSFSPYLISLRHIAPTPDVLTIDRAELPEVVERDGLMRADGLDYGPAFNATQHRKRALAQLAVSEFLAAREKAEQDAADQHAAILNKRRDELAVELFGYDYAFLKEGAAKAIDRIIELEGRVKK